jgi:trans-2,3-dihydro-3-hydroxyanthranilate isomerase
MNQRTFPFALVDAFTSKPLAGNPCAVVMNSESLSSSEMLAIAKEMNQSETAFLMKSQVADLKARYFTPEREIPLAGHPTIASIHAAIETGFLRLPDSNQVSLELNEGPIKVGLEKSNQGLLIRMFQRKPAFFETHDSKIVLPMFNLDESDALPNTPIQTVSTGTRQLMVPLKSHASLKKLSMNIEAYKAYRDKMNFFSPHFFCVQGATRDGATFARHLGVPPDTMEDAFTGSATGGMAAYLFKYGLIDSPRFIAEQGHWMDRPGQAVVDIIGDRKDIESIVVSGQAVTTVKGILNI